MENTREELEGFVTFVRGLVAQMEDAEVPTSKTEWDDGYNNGCKDTQEVVVKKLNYALKQLD